MAALLSRGWTEIGFAVFTFYGFRRDGLFAKGTNALMGRFFRGKAGLAVLTFDRLRLDLFLAKRTFTNGVLS
jgi:hypothetical protein